jgi:hypothetical protein
MSDATFVNMKKTLYNDVNEFEMVDLDGFISGPKTCINKYGGDTCQFVVYSRLPDYVIEEE